MRPPPARRALSAPLAALALLSAPPPAVNAAPAAPPQRIRIARNAITARVVGVIGPRSTGKRYRVNARKGQRMIVHTASLTRDFATVAVVTAPSGKQDGQKGPVSFNETLTESGDYTVRVSPNMMASNRRGGRFLLEIVIY